ncbi:protoporphyrinogen/coproporphyrinogen oxidase [Microbacterium halophytorum]|uniref:protoporphyrinogen/coproporphyrinogen oxidase n=1 Tax=Microbacterium halophytorum TaxID=2067568 RepID=UPI000CFADBF6|nr:FAD-dependent oxidoreductase [Microbacterium halophytorum]
MEEVDLVALRERAAGIRVAVIGAGVAGLVAAREFAGLGFAVDVYEADERPGGAVRSGELAGVRLDFGAESFATRGGHVRKLIDELGIGGLVVDADPGTGGAWLAGLPGGKAAPLPKGGLLGIPASPFAPDVRRILGTGGALKAYLADTLKPVLTIGHAHSLGRLVRTRLGDDVADRLVAPITHGVYSADPDDIDPDAAAPGLGAAITKTGRLFSAVDYLQAERRGAAKAPGAAVQGISGGMGRLVDALVADAEAQGVSLRLSTPVMQLEREGDSWRVRAVAGHPDAADSGADAARARDADAPDAAEGGPRDDLGAAADAERGADAPAGPGETAAGAMGDAAPLYDAVFVATGEGAARRLLAPHVDGLDPEPAQRGPAVAVVTLVLDAPELDAAPRGTGVLTVPGSFRAKALTQASAKWAWVREAAGPGRHVVRVSFGAQGEPPATDGLSEADAAALALGEASAMLGVALPAERLVAARVERFDQSQPAAALGRRAAVDRARAAVAKAPAALGVAGAWVSGTGLAQVVPDAKAEAARLRHVALWAGEAADESAG